MLVKLQEVRDILQKDRLQALRVAARLSESVLGSARSTIQTGWQAHQSPEFYQEIGKDPQKLVADAFRAIEQLTTEPPAD